MAAAMFRDWQEYFFMIGSSAAALIGLMFVVVTLTGGRERDQLEHGKHLFWYGLAPAFVYAGLGWSAAGMLYGFGWAESAGGRADGAAAGQHPRGMGFGDLPRADRRRQRGEQEAIADLFGHFLTRR